ncbi:MAG: hypothetical protein C0434_06800 [Xanthomonadaceae bacterium]|nr:hypothetical protein [Xanthomonadaceae bacterium]
MKGTVLHGPGDIRFEDVPDPTIELPTDVVIRIAATCVCGSDLWPYRGLQQGGDPRRMGHEYCGYVEDVGSAVTSVKRGQFVVGSFATSDNTCPTCGIGYQSSCRQREFVSQAQSPYLRVPNADGTLVATRERPDAAMIPGLLATSDVFGTGWYAADAAHVKPGVIAVVVGDGAVGLMAVRSAKQMGAERIIVMSRTPARQAFGPGRRGLQGHGRTPRDQDPAATVMSERQRLDAGRRVLTSTFRDPLSLRSCGSTGRPR